MRFAVQFIRQGISFFVTQLQDPQNVRQYDISELRPIESFGGGPSAFLSRQFQNEKETLINRIKEIQTIIQMGGDELNPNQKKDLD